MKTWTTLDSGSLLKAPRRLAAALLLVTIGAAGGCQSSASEGAAPDVPLQAVRTEQARPMRLRETIDYVGTVRSSQEVKVLARVMGTVTALPVEEGAAVREGQEVAVVGVPDLDARRQRLAADVLRARSEQRYLCNRLEIDRKLHQAGALAPVKVDASESRCQSARQAVSAARAGAREISATRARSVERAPFAGRVLKWLVEPGEHVAPGRPILLLGNDRVEVSVQVTEGDLARGIGAGTPALLAVRGRAEAAAAERPEGQRPVAEATVSSIAPLASGAGRTVDVRVPLPPELQGFARNGASVDVAFILRQEARAVAVPEAALRSTVDEATIFIVVEGRVAARRVVPGITERGWVSVSPAPPPGARVAVTNLDVLRDGARVYAVAGQGGER